MKVLIVDDSELLQVRLAKAISTADSTISITRALSCKEALELFPPSNPDKIILDIALPDGSGINLLKIFKKVEPGVPVIIFTNYPTDEFRDCCIKLGADEFISKKNIGELLEKMI